MNHSDSPMFYRDRGRSDGSSERGYRLAPMYRSYWPRLLEEWSLLVDRYCRFTDGRDTPYQHNERANTSILAAAAWRVGMIALEEFPASKKASQNQVNGRADLWLQAEEFGEGDVYEAKYVQCSLEKAVSASCKKLDPACSDVVKHVDPWYLWRIGIVFCCVWHSVETTNSISRFVDELRDTVQQGIVDAAAWTFPPIMSQLLGGELSKEGWYPGVALLMRVQSRDGEDSSLYTA